MTSRNLIYISLVALVALLAWFLFGRMDEIPIRNNDSAGTTIVAFGDSLVRGVGSTPGNDWVSIVSSRIGQPIVNLGKSGDTTRDALARIDGIFAHDPKLVILLIGGNDALRRIPLEETFSNIEKMIASIQAQGAAVLLVGIRGGVLGDPYAELFEDLSGRYETGYVSNVLSGLIGKAEFMSDAIHPNDAGYARIADRIEAEVRRALDMR